MCDSRAGETKKVLKITPSMHTHVEHVLAVNDRQRLQAPQMPDSELEKAKEGAKDHAPDAHMSMNVTLAAPKKMSLSRLRTNDT